DGVTNKLLYGKAPGNAFYRAAMLVGGLALGNFVLVNGFLVALLAVGSSSGDDDSAFALLIPLAIGAGLIFMGYRAFRYGEEVEQADNSSKKAKTAAGGEGEMDWSDVMQTGMSFLEEASKMADSSGKYSGKI
ncbi:MAG: hypothetical protein KDD89_09255, partial [Anaerolineales bacterium]|nr:hypothetical protein [Anaerolineales bacterium]